MDRIPEIALDWHRAGKGAALCTVVQTWGSAPRRVGSQLVVSGLGEIQGSVSGGCVEGAVIVEALEALDDGKHRLLEFGVSDDDAFAVGLACGGTIRVLVEPVGSVLPEDVLAELVEARANRQAVAVEADLEEGARRIVHDGYAEIVKKHYPDTAPIDQVDKYDFYDRTRKAFAVVMTGDVRIYANLILAKGVTTW